MSPGGMARYHPLPTMRRQLKAPLEIDNILATFNLLTRYLLYISVY